MEPVREGELHPLQNTNILQKIFKKLKLKDLKCCRLVCREWRQESAAAMRQIALVGIRGDIKKRKRISDFLELVRVEGEENAFSVPPFMKNFKIQLSKADSRRFWKHCGSSIKSLELVHVSFKSRDTFRHAIFHSCPNLEALSMHRVEVAGINVQEPKEWTPALYSPNLNLKSLKTWGCKMGGVSWLDLLSQFPGLEKFDELASKTLADFFASLALVRRHNDQNWRIKGISFSFRVAPEILGVLEDRNMPLESLSVRVVYRPECVDAMRRILIVHSGTLKNLYLDIGDELIEGFHFPNNVVFENVTNLDLAFAYPQSSNFIKLFPNLKKLSLECVASEPNFSQGLVGDWVLSSCTELSIRWFFTLAFEDLQSLVSRLPNLKKLETFFCRNDKFAWICELLPNLVELNLSNTYVDDTGISGLDQEDVARINKEGEENQWRPITIARPYLFGLKELKRLEWKGDENVVLGYSFVLCVQKLPQLQHLRLPDECSNVIRHFQTLCNRD